VSCAEGAEEGLGVGAKEITKDEREGLWEIAKEFLRLGFLAFGGPPVHLAMMEERFVRRKRWLSRERFVDLLGAANLLPGPSSTELAIYLGELRGGFPGLLLAGACFILPAALMVAGLAWAYQKYGRLPQVEGLLFGIKPVVVALIIPALWNLGKTALKNTRLVMLAIGVAVLSSMGLNVISLLIVSGICGLWCKRHGRAQTWMPQVLRQRHCSPLKWWDPYRCFFIF
jgi:chromate transporter